MPVKCGIRYTFWPPKFWNVQFGYLQNTIFDKFRLMSFPSQWKHFFLFHSTTYTTTISIVDALRLLLFQPKVWFLREIFHNNSVCFPKKAGTLLFYAKSEYRIPAVIFVVFWFFLYATPTKKKYDMQTEKIIVVSVFLLGLPISHL